MSDISAKHALSQRELDMCKIWLAFGKRNAAEAYRRAFCAARSDGEYVDLAKWEPDEAATLDLDRLPAITTDQISRRAGTVLGQDYVQRYIDECERPAGLTARGVLSDHALFGSDSQQARAAEQILKDEDKLGQRDAGVVWAEILMDIGADIEIPLPHECRHLIVRVCEKCGEREEFEFTEPLVVRHKIAEMFRKIQEADSDGIPEAE